MLDIADMIVEDFLYQNAFSPYDFMCPLPKSVSSSKNIMVKVFEFTL